MFTVYLTDEEYVAFRNDLKGTGREDDHVEERKDGRVKAQGSIISVTEFVCPVLGF